MENLVGVVNKLQDVFTTVGKDCLQLPQIIVVGTQSSGKSSVLESLVGRSFLPRGAGIITRRPLILQMVQSNRDDRRRKLLSEEKRYEDWGIFLHDENSTFTNFDDIRKEIENETSRIAGSNMGICSEPIVLKIFSDRNLNLTMVDLPGITKVPVGDQPIDVELMVRELILKYIQNPNSIILAIVTANTDMVTSESLKIAREVDPQGLRTIAVVTKLDLMDAGTDAMDVLCGKVIPVKLGIIGVVNRSQKDIQEGKSIKDALVYEANFLRDKYPNIASRHGSTSLAKTLQKLLMEHIKNCLPDLKSRVNTSIAHYQGLLSSYGVPMKGDAIELLDILTKFSNSFCSTIQGTNKNLQTSELGGGARISYIFHETFTKALESIDPLAGFNYSSIMTAMRNASGAKPSLFIPEICFELLVKKFIKKLEAPSLRCVDLVNEEMERIAHNCGPEISLEMQRFPLLDTKVKEVVRGLLAARLPETNKMVESLIHIQAAYINTGHPDFVRETKLDLLEHNKIKFSREAITDGAHNVMSIKQDPENVPRDCVIIENLIISYFNIVKKTVLDCVPKAIMHFLVNYVMDHLLSELVSELYNPANVSTLLSESEKTKERRAETTAILKALEKANSIIGEVKETNLIW
jgi:dynamin 1-like protein